MMYIPSKRTRAETSGIRLTDADAALVKGMLRRGDRQHDIAAWFGVNGGRIAEIATGHTFGWVIPAQTADLPPQGPYPSGRQSREVQWALDSALDALVAAEASIRSLQGHRPRGNTRNA